MKPILLEDWPKQHLERINCCPLCGSARHELMHGALRDIFFQCAPGQWDMWRCLDCSSSFLDPRPTRETIGRAYASYYTHEVGGGSGEFSWLSRLRRRLKNGYLNRQYGTHRKDSLGFGYWLVHLLPLTRQAVDAEARHLPRPPMTGGRLLDVGCGSGAFLAFAAELGWRVKGVDFDHIAVAIARNKGLDVVMGGVDALNEPEESYDWITLSHVIEHVHDPLGMLQSCYRLLKVGGKLWLETPNIESFGHRVFGRFWRGLEPPRHLVVYSRDALQSNLNEAGFEQNIWIRNYGVPKFMWKASRKALSDSGESLNAFNPIARTYLGHYLADILEYLRPQGREFLTVLSTKTSTHELAAQAHENSIAIDILLATYNGERFLAEQLNSLLAQRSVNIRVLVHDDGSTDATRDILQNYAQRFPDKIVLIDGPTRLGARGNFAYLLQHVAAPYVALSDQDDVWLQNKLRILLAKIHEMEAAYGKNTPLLVHCDLEVVDEGMAPIHRSFWCYQGINPARDKLNHLLVQNNVTGCASLMNLALVRYALPIPGFARMHDHWIALVASAFGHASYVRRPLVKYRQHEKNTLGARRACLPEDLRHAVRVLKEGRWHIDIHDMNKQPSAFLRAYGDSVTPQQWQLLDDFMHLHEKGVLVRIRFLIRYDVLPAGFVRKVALLLRV